VLLSLERSTPVAADPRPDAQESLTRACLAYQMFELIKNANERRRRVYRSSWAAIMTVGASREVVERDFIASSDSTSTRDATEEGGDEG
jgi:hypothetical protein